MSNLEIPQPYRFRNNIPSIHEIVKITEFHTLLIDILKRKPYLLSQTLQTVNDITTTGLKPSGLASETLRKNYHDFRVYFIAPYSEEDICRLVYSNDDKRGLRIEFFPNLSFFGKYYETQLKAVAMSRRIPFGEITFD